MTAFRQRDFFSLASPAALEGFLEAAPDAIIVVDTTGTIVVANGLRAHELSGGESLRIHGTELLGVKAEALVPPRYRGHHRRTEPASCRFDVYRRASPRAAEGRC
jgi:PAS domain-containing protein